MTPGEGSRPSLKTDGRLPVPAPSDGPVRLKICRYLSQWVLTIIGLALVTLAVGSYELGLDNNPGWGPYREAFFIIGLAA